MNFEKLCPVFSVIAAVGVLYNEWEHKYLEKEQNIMNHNIKKYLLNRQVISDYDLFSLKLLYGFILIMNLMPENWESFNSRSSRE